jgi:hypothetical protein
MAIEEPVLEELRLALQIVTDSLTVVIAGLTAIASLVSKLNEQTAPTPDPVPLPIPVPPPTPTPVPPVVVEPPPVVVPPVVTPPVVESFEVVFDRLWRKVWAEERIVLPLDANGGLNTGWVSHFQNAWDTGATLEQMQAAMRNFLVVDGWAVLPPDEPVVVPPVVVPVPPVLVPAPGYYGVEDMILDMSEPSPVSKSWNYDWQKRPYVMMGNVPKGRNDMPAWMGGYGKNIWWERMGPWFIFFEQENNQAYADVKLCIHSLKCAFLVGGQWIYPALKGQLGGMGQAQGGNYFNGTKKNITYHEANGTLVIEPLQGVDYHGWVYAYDLPKPQHLIQAVAIQAEATMRTNNPNAKFGFMVSADYQLYADRTNTSVVPSVAQSGIRPLINNERRVVTAITLSDTGVQDPGGGITKTHLRANPPVWR